MIEEDIPIQDSRLGQGKFRFDLRSDLTDLSDAQEVALHRHLSRVDDLAALAHKPVASIRAADHGKVMGTGMDAALGKADFVIVIDLGSEHAHQIPVHRYQTVTAILRRIIKGRPLTGQLRELRCGKQHGLILFPVVPGLLERNIGAVRKVILRPSQEFRIGDLIPASLLPGNQIAFSGTVRDHLVQGILRH